VVQVLKESNKNPTTKSYMWVQTGGPPDKPVIIYDYDASRSGEVPVRLLHDYRGYLMADAYDRYNQLARTEGIEREHKDATDEVRMQARREHSTPILAKIRGWLDAVLSTVLPRSALGSALSCIHNQWDMLIRYTERGDLPIDNNRCENAIRPVVVARRARLLNHLRRPEFALPIINRSNRQAVLPRIGVCRNPLRIDCGNMLRPKNCSRFHYCSRFQFDVARMPEYGLTDKSGVYGALTVKQWRAASSCVPDQRQ
jgi:hypothetical protein